MSRSSFRGFTFVSNNSSESENESDASSDDDGKSDVNTTQVTRKNGSKSNSNRKEEEEEDSEVEFEDPEFIVTSILRGITATDRSKRLKLTPTPTLTPPPPAQEESEHQRILRLRAERFRGASEGTVTPNTKPAPPPPKRLYSNRFLFPSLPQARLTAVQRILGTSSASAMQKPVLDSVFKATKPIELSKDMLVCLKQGNTGTTTTTLPNLFLRVKALLDENNIVYSVSKEDKQVLLFPVPLQLNEHLYHWLCMRTSFAGPVAATATARHLPTGSLGCFVYPFGVSREEELACPHAYDVRTLSSRKLDRYEELFTLLLGAPDLSQKIDAALRNRANALFVADDAASANANEEEEEVDFAHEEFTVRELSRMRRDLQRQLDANVDKAALISAATATTQQKGEPSDEALLDIFRKAHCSPVLGANLLRESGVLRRELDLAFFKRHDLLASTAEVCKAEDNAFSKRVSGFLHKVKVIFRQDKNTRALLVSSPLVFEEHAVQWVLPLNSLVVGAEEIALMQNLAKEHGAGCVMFSAGFPPSTPFPANVVGVDWRMIALAE